MDAATVTAWALFITAVGTLLTAVIGAFTFLATKRVEHATNGLTQKLADTKLAQGKAEGKAEGLQQGRNEKK